jgi:hypothetical protein
MTTVTWRATSARPCEKISTSARERWAAARETATAARTADVASTITALQLGAAAAEAKKAATAGSAAAAAAAAAVGIEADRLPQQQWQQPQSIFNPSGDSFGQGHVNIAEMLKCSPRHQPHSHRVVLNDIL